MGYTHFDRISAVNGYSVGRKGAEVAVISPDRYLYVAKGAITYSGGATQDIATLPANSLVLEVILHITTAFNGTGATIDIGDSGDIDRFIANADVAEGSVGFVRSSKTSAAGAHGHLYSTATTVQAAVNAGTGGTQGAATVYVLYAKVA